MRGMCVESLLLLLTWKLYLDSTALLLMSMFREV